MTALGRLALVVMAFYALVVGGACAIQSMFIYFPDRERVDPARIGLPVEEVPLTAPDGTAVVTWRAAPAAPGAPTIMYFHGNASNLANRARFFAMFLQEGWGLQALSYRSYGGSEGVPSEAANVGDALAYFDAVAGPDGIDPRSIVLYGESLGSGVAAQVAASRDVGGLVLHAPYDSVEDVAAWRAPFLFPRRFLRDRYRSIDVIADVEAPILWLHGDRDGVIPIRFGRRLFDAATGEKSAAIIPGAGHNDLYGRAVFEAHTRPFVNAAVPTPD